jgi:Cytochrome P460
MKRRHVASMVILSASIFVVGIAFAEQDRFSLKSPNGIAFSEFKDYDAWQVIATSTPGDAGGCGSSPEPGCIKAIVGNPVMIKAYRDGFPANGKPVPDGAAMAKIEWQKKREVSAYPAIVPGTFMEVAFMLKDAKRFPDTNGWGYATLRYGASSDTWKAFGDSPEFASTCHACHTIVKANDYVFTAYPKR